MADAETSPKARPLRAVGFLSAHKALFIAIASGVVIVALVIAWIATSAAQQGEIDSLHHQLTSAHTTISTKQTEIDNYANQADAVKQAQDQLKQDQAKLAADQASLKAGQDALAAQTQLVQASQFGDGQYTVGQTVTPGVYRENAGGDCYYEWASSTASDASIVSNDIPGGPATVTLRTGDIFSSSRCGTWTKIG
jgi:cell division protein FtsL